MSTSRKVQALQNVRPKLRAEHCYSNSRWTKGLRASGKAQTVLDPRRAQGEAEDRDRREGTGTVAVSTAQCFVAEQEQPESMYQSLGWVVQYGGSRTTGCSSSQGLAGKLLRGMSRQGRQLAGPEGTGTHTSNLVDLPCGILLVPVC